MLRLLGPKHQGDAPPSERLDPLRSLATAAARGDRAAERTLLIETGSALLRTIRAVLGNQSPEVEDVFQEAMTGVHLALPGFRGECSTLHFICRIGVQTAMNARRRRRTRARHAATDDDGDVSELAGAEASPAQSLAAARRRAALRDLLSELPPAQAEVLTLHTVLGHTLEETAAVTGVPVNTARSRLRRALSLLRAAIATDAQRLEIVKEEP